MAIIAGLENGSIKGDDREGKKANYDLIVEMVNEFKNCLDTHHIHSHTHSDKVKASLYHKELLSVYLL